MTREPGETGKGPQAFRTISEVAEELGLPQHVLRFWETRFPQIKPIKRGGGRRYYRPADVDLLRGVKQLLYGQGYTIRGVQRILREQGGRKAASEAGWREAPEDREEPAAPEPDFAPGLAPRPEGPDVWAPRMRRAESSPADEAAAPDSHKDASGVMSQPEEPGTGARGLSPAQAERLGGVLADLRECRRLLGGAS